MEFNWKLSVEDRERVERIVDRYIDLCATSMHHKSDDRESREDRIMDLIACHNHACRLDLKKLLEADNFNLLHDVFGIKNCLNRTTGQLENCFLPRCAF